MADSSGTIGKTPTNLGNIERAVSIGIGAALLVRVLGRTVLVPAALGLGAAALIWRGVNGVCPVKAGLCANESRNGDGGEPSRRAARRARQAAAEADAVSTASEDSFPASDPPAWTPTTGSARRH